MAHDFRARLQRGETLIGTIVTLPAAASAEMLAGLGFDWLFIDGEHTALEPPELAAILQAVSHRIPCIVRVPEAAEVPIKKALDLGAHGIIAPQVNTPEQAADVVRWARYPPEGARGVGLGRAPGYG
jgi:2-dehydro-3-deoxyglucarate aldolase